MNGWALNLKCGHCGDEEVNYPLDENQEVRHAEWEDAITEAEGEGWQRDKTGWLCPDCASDRQFEADIRATEKSEDLRYAAGLLRDITKHGGKV